MHGTLIKSIKDPGPLKPTGKMLLLEKFGVWGAIAFILIAFGGASATGDTKMFWQLFVIFTFFFTGFALYGMVLPALHYAINAAWSTNVRRVAEGFTAFLIPAYVCVMIVIAFGMEHVYDWAADEALHHHFDHLKQLYLSQGGYAIIATLFFGVMLFFRKKIITDTSLKQDETGDISLSKKVVSWSTAFLFVFLYLFTLFVTQFLLSVNSTWFSTMFGVYAFIGIFLSGFSAVAIVTVILMKAGYLKDAIKEHTLKDLGTWQMGFAAFMMYVGFSQFMLIWYANLPAEVAYMQARMNGGWEYIFILLPTLKWVIPFVFLMPWRYRSNPNAFKLVGGLLIFGQWLDIFWMVMPGGIAGPEFSWLILPMLIAFAMAFGFFVLKFYTKHSLLAHKDPKLLTAINGQHL